jgi:hypothetical protein
MPDSNHTRIYIAIPAYGGLINARTVKGLLDFQKWCFEKKIYIYTQILMNESLITRARNELVADMLGNDFNATHILFIDADIGFNYKNIERLLMKDKEIVCGVYPLKDFFWNLAKDAIKKNPDITPLELERNSLKYAVNFEDPQNINTENGYAIVKDAATGMMLVKRKVFEKLINSYPERKYNYQSQGKKHLEHTYDFFSVGVFDNDDDKTYLSEDYYFSRLWQKIGGEIWVDLHSPLTHSGNYTFKGNFFSRFDKHQ